MEIKILGSTKPEFKLTKEEASNFAGKAAGICYLPSTMDELFNENIEKTERRAKMTLNSGHHSVYDHPMYNLGLVDVPKIIAMIINNEKMYTTSEKSARYTKMKVSPEEEKLYLKWIDIYKAEIQKRYEQIDDKKAVKLAQENARKLISIFTPSTTMEYTVSFRQINYIMHWSKNYIKTAEDNSFNKMLKPYMQEFIDCLKDLYVEELNSDLKNRKISLFATRIRKEEFGENYCINYKASWDEFAQAQRHRTIDYEIQMLKEPEYSIPKIIKGTELEKEWLEDIKSLSHLYPQGMLIHINERGTAENFILKCQERLCGEAQLDIALHTKENLDRYLENIKNTNEELYEELKQYGNGPRCTFKGFTCTNPCIFGPKEALNRYI